MNKKEKMDLKKDSDALRLLKKLYPNLTERYKKEASWVGSIHSELFTDSKLSTVFENKKSCVRNGEKNKDILESKNGADIVVANRQNKEKCCNIEVKFSAWKSISNVSKKVKKKPQLEGWGWSFGKNQNPHVAVLIGGTRKSLFDKIFVLPEKTLGRIQNRKGMSGESKNVLYTTKNKKAFWKQVKKKLKIVHPFEKKLSVYSDPKFKKLIRLVSKKIK